jgi:tetratricopeptide (TPR) repeat protein
MRVRATTLAFLLCPAVQGQTFNRDIAPILHDRCAPCHRPGEAAPFSLLEYSDAKKRSRQIAAVTTARVMPPWKPEAGKGEFSGELRLSDEQVRVIQEWAARGAPEGDPKDRPQPPTFTEGWQLGKPDLIVTLERPYTMAASGSDVFRNFVLPVPVETRRYVRAVEIRPGNKKVVHHANLLLDRGRSSRIRDGKDGFPGFPGMDTSIETHTFDPESHFLFWKPGTSVLEEPEGMSWQMDPNTDLVLNVHLQPSGKPEPIQPSVGLYFTDTAPVHFPILVQLEHDGAIDIPPGKSDFMVTDKLRLPVDVDVLGVYPHAHYVGKDIQAFATLPDGTRRWLIHIADWDINWQAVYRYRAPVFLPAGTVISMRFTYDNSAANPRNPNNPPARVVNGDRSSDEMAHLWLQVLPRPQPNEDARMVLQEAVLRRRLEKYSADFFAEYSLGAMLQSRGRFEEAIGHYRRALAVSPHHATARNALGTALQIAGNLEGAMAEFEAALRARPDYPDAHLNLARLLLTNDRLAEAIPHLREVIRLDPRDAAALSDLGAALQLAGKPQESMRYLLEAVRIQPDHFNARYNLGQALAATGKVAEAEAQFREALRLNPGDADTRDALKRLTGK